MERKKRVVPGETCVKCFERSNRICEDALNTQESAEVIVSRSANSARDEGLNQEESLVRPGKEERAHECRKHRKLLAER